MKRWRFFGISVCFLLLLFCCACSGAALPTPKNDFGSDEAPAVMASTSLRHFTQLAQTALWERLGVKIPAGAKGTYRWDEQARTLRFGWTQEETGEEGQTRYDILFENVDVKRGEGTAIFSLVEGDSASFRQLVQTFSTEATEAFADLLQNPVPENSQLLVTLIMDRNRRTVFLDWSPASDSPTTAARYTAAFAAVSRTYRQGDLMTLQIEPRTEPVWESGQYTEEELAAMREAAEQALLSWKLTIVEYNGYRTMNASEKGDVCFRFKISNSKYKLCIVSVNANNNITSIVFPYEE